MVGRTILAPGSSALGLALGLALVIPAVAGEPRPQDLEFFESKVRPILVERCYSCHSSEAKKSRGNLLLDSKDGWQKGGDSGPAIVLGAPDQSPLLRAIRYDDPDLKMPPKGKLPAREIAILEDWVKRGAPDPRTRPAAPSGQRVIDIESGRTFWSFQPLSSATPPKVRDESWCVNDIDRFILASLEARGITPNRALARRQLIRRASFDLIGLPPTPEEVEAFVADASADAYDRLLDRLLASPHYGERWGRHWLDLARFAESHGFEHDTDRPSAYHYRDFVTEALNQDLPFNTFVTWQIAGDEVAPENPLALKATGFLAAGVHSTQITANQVEKERYDELDDIASTIGTSMLGLTIGCARCHDHKYDPIPQRDYYRLVSTFTTTVRTEVELNVDPSGLEQARAAFLKEHEPYVTELARFEAEDLPRRLEAWERDRSASTESPAWLALDFASQTSQGGATFSKCDDNSWLVSGKNPDFDTYTLVAPSATQGITAIRLEALPDPSLVRGGPGRAPNGNFALTDFRVTAAPKDGSSAPEPVRLRNARASFEQSGLPIQAAIDGDLASGWAIDPEFGKPQSAIFEVEGDLGHPSGTVLTFVLDFRGNNRHGIGRFRLSVTSLPRSLASLYGETIPMEIWAILAKPRAERSKEQASALLRWYRTIDPVWQARKKAVEEHLARGPKPRTSKALISSEGLPAVRLNTQGGDFLEKTHLLKRGDPNQKLEEVLPGYLQVQMSSATSESRWQIARPAGSRTTFRRASLANWLTDPEGGAGRLLARVIVNRLWQHHMGRGIVATPSDFGAQGERPTHPELLDDLAKELIRGGWRLKPIHRLIMTSAAYRQDARIDPVKRKLDPENRLFWRQERRRLEAETIRDAMLAVSGQLDPTMFGPGTLDPNQKRRSLYFTVKRSRLIPMMTLFDAPDTLQGIAIRPTTTVAPQSLLLLNSAIVRGWAESFASRIARASNGSREEAIRSGYQIALGRPPASGEEQDAKVFLNRQAELHRKGGGGDPEGMALRDFAQVLLSLNEFLYVE